MSNINGGNKNNPFRAANDRLPNIPQGVGSNYGDRIKYQKLNNSAPATAPANRAVDQFSSKKAKDASMFASNATFKNSRRSASGAPYKPAILNSFENGMIPRAKKEGQPSDDALVNFLDRVIAYKKTIQA